MTALQYLIGAVASLAILIFMLRLLLPMFRANFQNPVSQGIMRLTSPVVNPLRRIVPSIGRMDTATVIVLLAIQMGSTALLNLLAGRSTAIGYLMINSILDLLSFAVTLLLIVLIIRIVLSWFGRDTYNPLVEILYALTEPLLRPVRRLLPPMGGLDISIIPVFIGLTFFIYLIQDIRVAILTGG